jgi:prepilin-type N-terminal cleavage/methylation domain-containing protein
MLTSSLCSRRSSSRGFTLIELLVVISIMAVITAALLLNQSRFDSSTLLRSLAYSVALSVRQSQIYGSSVLGTSVASQSNCTGTYVSGLCYANAYGVHFTNGSSSYILFADLNNNGTYDSGTDAIVKTFTFSTGYGIADLCATPLIGGTPVCFSGGTFNTLDVVFHRPNPEACFSSSANPTACAPGGVQAYSQIKITLSNLADPSNTRSVTATQTGEIAVCAQGGC